ncbi:MAG: beta-lactamase family protein [Bacteroidetes bacterium]|nr:beta-lactamase family protein [Bacteroidota bacterium]
MKKYYLISGVIFLLLTLISACQPAEIVPTQVCTNPTGNYESHPKALELQQVIDKYAQQGLPGISLLIRDGNGEWAGASGLADIEQNINMQPCHVSKIASVTKLFVGVLVMQLVDEGVLNLDDPISTWMPEKSIAKIENADKATLRQLLNHTSGIYDIITDNTFYLNVLNSPGRFWKSDELLKYAEGKPANFEPGADVKYSNTNLLLAAMIIEEATGKSHAQMIRDRIIDPLGMDNTYYHWHDKLPNFVAQGYYDLYNNGTISNLSNYNTGSGNGYGGIYSTVYDMQIFIEALLREKTLLSPAALEEMLKITSENVERNIAFGVAIRKDFLDRSAQEYGLGHRGRDLAYSADLYYFPNQDITMSYLVNYGTDGKSGLQEVFFNFRDELVGILMRE